MALMAIESAFCVMYFAATEEINSWKLTKKRLLILFTAEPHQEPNYVRLQRITAVTESRDEELEGTS